MAVITIEQFLQTDWQFDSDTVELRIYANQYFVANDGTVLQPPAFDQPNGIFYQAITCTPDTDAKTLLIPSFTIESTTDAQPGNCTYLLALYSGPSPSGVLLTYFAGLTNAVVAAAPLTTNLPALININGQPAQSNLFSYYAVFWQIAAAFWSAVEITPNSTSFSVLNHNSFFTANTEATDITVITDGYIGQVIYIFIRDTFTSIFGDSRTSGEFLTFGFNGTDWIAQSPASGLISWNGRTGVVVPVTGDYTAAEVTDAAAVNVDNEFSVTQSIIEANSGLSAVLKLVNNNSVPLILQQYGSTAPGNKLGGLVPVANLAELVAQTTNLLIRQFGSSGSIWFGTNDILRAKLNSAALELKVPLQLDGATSGQTQLTVPAVAGDFKVLFPANIPDIGDVLTVLSITLGTPNIIELDYEEGGGGGSPSVYDLASQAFGLLAPSQIVGSFVACRAFTLGITGSTGYCGTAPTADADFIVRYSIDNGANWITKATLRFEAASHISTIISSVSTAIASGDLIQILAPSSSDTTLADVTFTIKSKASDATSYDLSGQANGGLANSQVIFTFVADRSFTLSLTGSTGSSGTAANAQTDFLIRYSSNNGSSWTNKGTMRFAAAAKVTTLVGEVSTSVSSGDLVQLIGPATADTTLADVTFSLVGSV